MHDRNNDGKRGGWAREEEQVRWGRRTGRSGLERPGQGERQEMVCGARLLPDARMFTAGVFRAGAIHSLKPRNRPAHSSGDSNGSSRGGADDLRLHRPVSQQTSSRCTNVHSTLLWFAGRDGVLSRLVSACGTAAWCAAQQAGAPVAVRPCTHLTDPPTCLHTPHRPTSKTHPPACRRA